MLRETASSMLDKQPRQRAVLERAAREAGYQAKVSPGRAFGVASLECYDSHDDVAVGSQRLGIRIPKEAVHTVSEERHFADVAAVSARAALGPVEVHSVGLREIGLKCDAEKSALGGRVHRKIERGPDHAAIHDMLPLSSNDTSTFGGSVDKTRLRILLPLLSPICFPSTCSPPVRRDLDGPS